jgi:hypothetical protein
MPSDFITVNPAQARALAVRSSAAEVAKVTSRVAVRARTLAPGSMKGKIRPVSMGGPAPIGIVICDHPAAMFVLQGTKKHDIRPRQAKVLAFKPRGSGKTVFARVVHHPGTKANNFLLKALHSV